MSAYEVTWTTKDFERVIDYFVTGEFKLMSTSYIHLCADAKKQAVKFASDLINDGINEVSIKRLLITAPITP